MDDVIKHAFHKKIKLKKKAAPKKAKKTSKTAIKRPSLRLN
jgi:hypothetical protein